MKILRFHLNALKDYPNYDALLASAVSREGDYVTIDTDGAAYRATLPKVDPNLAALRAMERAGMTPAIAKKQAKRRGCCDPPI